MKSWKSAIAGLALTLSMNACAWDDGEPFAVLSPHLDARLDIPADRDVGMGWQRLASGYEIAIATLELEAEELSLVDGGDGGLTFDPANPPEGFSLCHNGHCHAADGSLVSYEEIAVQLGQQGSTSVVAAMDIGALDLIAGVSRILECEPSCDLPRANIALANLDVARLRAEGRVRDSAAPARIEGEIPWVLDLDLSATGELVLSTAIDLPANRGSDPNVTLDVELLVTSRVLDKAAFADLSIEPLGDNESGFDLDADPTTQSAILEALGELALGVAITR